MKKISLAILSVGLYIGETYYVHITGDTDSFAGFISFVAAIMVIFSKEQP